MSRNINKAFADIAATLPKDFKRGDIYYIENTTQAVGSEQRAGRPAVIVSNNTGNKHSECVIVVYMTTQPKTEMPTHVYMNSLRRASIALCESIVTVSKDRIGQFCGTATREEMKDIDEALAVALALKGQQDKQEPPQEPQPAAGEEIPAEKLKAATEAQNAAEMALQGARNEAGFYKMLYEDLLEKTRRLVCGGAANVSDRGNT